MMPFNGHTLCTNKIKEERKVEKRDKEMIMHKQNTTQQKWKEKKDAWWYT